MKRITTLLFLIFAVKLAVGGDNVKPSREKYISEHKDDAIRDMQKSGVPASITLAQACLESQDGGSTLAKEANNHFGIKCSDWNGPSYIQDDDKKDECFRKYKTTLESYDDHSLFLSTRPRYAFLFQLEKTDYKAWAKGLKKAGYATDPTYADRLIKIIEDNQLYLLDQAKDTQPIASINGDPAGAVAVAKPTAPKGAKKVFVPSVDAVDAFAARKIQNRNGIDCIIVKKGDDLKSLSRELKLGYWQLPKYNELKSDAQLNEGQIIYLKPKNSEAQQDVYTVKPGDSILSISQDFGVKSKYIYKYNDMKEGASVEPGQQIFLKKSHPAKS